MSGNKFVVTGGAGFIGSHLCEELLSQGKEVVSLDSYAYGTQGNIAHLRENPRFHAYMADISKMGDIKGKLDGADVVFNLAASKCTYCRLDPDYDMRVNAGGALNIAHEAIEAKVKKVVHVSSGSVYGPNPSHDIDVFQEDGVSYAPVSYYGVSKLAGERYLEAVREYYGLRYTIARYYHVYGPRQKGGPRGGVIPIFINAILKGEPIHVFGDGEQVRSFTFVDDTVKQTLRLAEDVETDGQAYNIASGLKISINVLIETLMDLMKKTVPVKYEATRSGDIYDTGVSNDKISSLGDFEWTRFKDGLEKTIAWYRMEAQNG